MRTSASLHVLSGLMAGAFALSGGKRASSVATRSGALHFAPQPLRLRGSTITTYSVASARPVSSISVFRATMRCGSGLTDASSVALGKRSSKGTASASSMKTA